MGSDLRSGLANGARRNSCGGLFVFLLAKPTTNPDGPEEVPVSFNDMTNAELLLAPSEEAIGGTQGTKLPAGTSIAILDARSGAKVVKVRARLDGREIDGWLGTGFLTR